MPEPELFMTLHEGFQPFTKVSTPKELYRKFISWFLGMAILAIVFEKSDLKLNDFFFQKIGTSRNQLMHLQFFEKTLFTYLELVVKDPC